jgi:hypothetical protein
VVCSSNFSLKVEKVTDHAHLAMEFAVLVSNKYIFFNCYLSHFCIMVLSEMNIIKWRMFSVKKGCGSTSSENSTYLDSSQSSKTDLSQCTYTICPKANVCRIRFDFAVSWHFSLESYSIQTTTSTKDKPLYVFQIYSQNYWSVCCQKISGVSLLL